MGYRTITLSANGEEKAKVVGDTVNIISSTGAVEVFTKESGWNYLESGESFTLRRGQFDEITIKDASGASNSVKYIAGFVINKSASLTGEVEIIQGSIITQSAVTVGTSEIELIAATAAAKFLIIQNLGAADIYIGGSGVTTGTGIKIKPDASLVIDHAAAAQWKAISGAAGNSVRVVLGV